MFNPGGSPNASSVDDSSDVESNHSQDDEPCRSPYPAAKSSMIDDNDDVDNRQMNSPEVAVAQSCSEPAEKVGDGNTNPDENSNVSLLQELTEQLRQHKIGSEQGVSVLFDEPAEETPLASPPATESCGNGSVPLSEPATDSVELMALVVVSPTAEANANTCPESIQELATFAPIVDQTREGKASLSNRFVNR